MGLAMATVLINPPEASEKSIPHVNFPALTVQQLLAPRIDSRDI